MRKRKRMILVILLVSVFLLLMMNMTAVKHLNCPHMDCLICQAIDQLRRGTDGLLLLFVLFVLRIHLQYASLFKRRFFPQVITLISQKVKLSD